MSYMAEVAKMLGVKMNEDFECYGRHEPYRITEDKITYNGVWSADSLVMILNGELKIKRKPWKPQHGDTYYCVSSQGHVLKEKWYGDVIDTLYYKLGNCYKTREEAEPHRDRWSAFYKSDDVLEI